MFANNAGQGRHVSDVSWNCGQLLRTKDSRRAIMFNNLDEGSRTGLQHLGKVSRKDMLSVMGRGSKSTRAQQRAGRSA